MKKFLDLKIGTKLVICFMILSLVAVGVGIAAELSLKRIGHADMEMYQENTLALQYSGSAAAEFNLLRYNVYKAVSVTNADDIETVSKTIGDMQQSLTADLEQCRNVLVTPQFIEEITQIREKWTKQYQPALAALASAAQSGDADDVSDSVAVLATVSDEMDGLLQQLIQDLSADAAATAADNNAATRSAEIIMIGIIVAGILISVGLTRFITRIIGKPINSASAVANRLAEGDVDMELQKTERRDEIGQLLNAFYNLKEATKNQVSAASEIAGGNLTVDIDVRSEQDRLGKSLATLAVNLRKIVSDIKASADMVASGANMMSDSSAALSQGAAEQAAAVEQLTASLDEINEMTQKNVKNSETANSFADETKENAEKGSGLMTSLMHAMDDISASSRDIAKIVKVIDDIAFQTNILALNAAVEAARAGQQGKGFAVVAEEVRALAAKSAGAVKETTALIESSLGKVRAGNGLASETAEALDRIVASAEKSAALAAAILQSSKAQAAGVGEISGGIRQISAVVQTNAATSEESAAASEELSGQAEQLKETIGAFKTEKPAGGSLIAVVGDLALQRRGHR